MSMARVEDTRLLTGGNAGEVSQLLLAEDDAVELDGKSCSTAAS